MSSPSAPNAPVFAAPHTAPAPGTFLTPPPPSRRGRPLGIWALLLSLAASVLASAIAGLLSFRIARGAGPGIAKAGSASVDLRVLSPVRDLVLAAEITFWTATALGIAAIALGIVAIVRRASRGAGIAAVVVAALGPVVFGVFVAVAMVGAFATVTAGGSAL